MMEAVPTPVAGDVLLLVGNPNVGKSALFSRLTGKYVIVSNYPGTTVDVTRGRFRYGGSETEVIDTPGIYSLHPQSEDEIVTRDLLLQNPQGVVVLVLDAKNLERGLLLAQQLGELRIRFCVALNMMDEARGLRFNIDASALAEALGVPVVPTVATTGKGLRELAEAVAEPGRGRFVCEMPPELAVSIGEIGRELVPAVPPHLADFLAQGVLVEPHSLPAALRVEIGPERIARIGKAVTRARRGYDVPWAGSISQLRRDAVNRLLDGMAYAPGRRPGGFAARMGRLATHPVWGLGIMGVVLWLVYLFVGVLGAGTLVDLIETRLFEGIINPAVTAFADRFVPIAGVRDFLVGDYGVVTMALTYSLAIILPVVGTFFIAFGILEDSGYMPRLAVMANRFFRRLGLHGKAILPMILGLGCDTMATLTTRILDTRKERVLVTLLLALGVPCSAQLAVIFGMLGSVSFFGLLIWLGVVTAVMLTVGTIAARILPGQASDFILELPPMRVPGIKNILIKTGARLEWYLKEAVPLFVLGTVLLFALDRMGALAVMRDVASPLVHNFLGLPDRATEAFMVGFLRRDYGAAGLLDLQRQGLMDGRQVVVSLVIITLFVPCVANFFVMIKERGWRTAMVMVAFIAVTAVAVGGFLNFGLRLLGVSL